MSNLVENKPVFTFTTYNKNIKTKFVVNTWDDLPILTNDKISKFVVNDVTISNNEEYMWFRDYLNHIFLTSSKF